MLILKREPRLDPRHQAFLYQVQAIEAVRNLEYAAVCRLSLRQMVSTPAST